MVIDSTIKTCIKKIDFPTSKDLPIIIHNGYFLEIYLGA